ncbi:MAG TPA: VOC family protein [Thermoanaerobaculia bacterium]|jgi:hypothetical protein
MAHPVTRWQILAADPNAVASFYAKVFDWRIDTGNAMGYRQIDTGSGIQGGIWPAPPGAPTFVQLFIEVEDVDAAIAKAAAQGAKVLVPKTELPDGDTMAILLDPHGMSFGLVEA